MRADPPACPSRMARRCRRLQHKTELHRNRRKSDEDGLKTACYRSCWPTLAATDRAGRNDQEINFGIISTE